MTNVIYTIELTEQQRELLIEDLEYELKNEFRVETKRAIINQILQKLNAE